MKITLVFRDYGEPQGFSVWDDHSFLAHNHGGVCIEADLHFPTDSHEREFKKLVALGCHPSFGSLGCIEK